MKPNFYQDYIYQLARIVDELDIPVMAFGFENDS